MSSRYAEHLTAPIPQSEPLPGQAKNNAGGYSFQLDDWGRLQRFLILGSEGGTYYVGERKLTLDNAAVVRRCVALDGLRTVLTVERVSHSGRAPKNDPALLALALCVKHGDAPTRKRALQALPNVARIGTHLFHFAEYLKAVGSGWGRATKRAFGEWYTDRSLESLALQLIKYQQRDGWSHRDILRKAHPKAIAPANDALHWAVKGWPSIGDEPHPVHALARIWAFERLKAERSPSAAAKLIADYALPHECVPNELKGEPVVWEALLVNMGLTAMIRNLGKMTAVGVLAPLSAGARSVVDDLSDTHALKSARVHPMTILLALKTYAQGHGERGKLTWSPVQPVVDALDAAFYRAFEAVEPTGKAHLLALDVSGSMDTSRIAGSSLSAREASMAMALVTANVEKNYAVVGFTAGNSPTMHHGYGAAITPLRVGARDRLDRACETTRALPFGGTDCALPMIYAMENKVDVDVFVIYTDSETWAGRIHPHMALDMYRQKSGIAAKLVVVGMTSTGFTIADPNDAGQLDIVGFDSATPALLSDFARDA